MNDSLRIRIGNQSAFSAPSVMQPFEYAVANGFDAFEWFPDKKESGEGWDEKDMSGEMRSLIRDTAAARDIRLSVHAAWQMNPLKAGTREYFSVTARFAGDIGASLINIHLYAGEGIAAFADAVAPLVMLARREGMKLSIENTPDTGPQDFNELFSRLSSMGSAAHVGMCLDIGHANLYGATRNDYLEFIDLLGPQVPVIHVHMHENYGDYDSHLPIFTGPSGRDLAGVNGVITRLKTRCFSGCIILEQWPQPPGLLVEGRNRLLSIIG